MWLKIKGHIWMSFHLQRNHQCLDQTHLSKKTYLEQFKMQVSTCLRGLKIIQIINYPWLKLHEENQSHEPIRRNQCGLYALEMVYNELPCGCMFLCSNQLKSKLINLVSRNGLYDFYRLLFTYDVYYVCILC